VPFEDWVRGEGLREIRFDLLRFNATIGAYAVLVREQETQFQILSKIVSRNQVRSLLALELSLE